MSGKFIFSSCQSPRRLSSDDDQDYLINYHLI